MAKLAELFTLVVVLVFVGLGIRSCVMAPPSREDCIKAQKRLNQVINGEGPWTASDYSFLAEDEREACENFR